jgi:hypothetical protein
MQVEWHSTFADNFFALNYSHCAPERRFVLSAIMSYPFQHPWGEHWHYGDSTGTAPFWQEELVDAASHAQLPDNLPYRRAEIPPTTLNAMMDMSFFHQSDTDPSFPESAFLDPGIFAVSPSDPMPPIPPAGPPHIPTTGQSSFGGPSGYNVHAGMYQQPIVGMPMYAYGAHMPPPPLLPHMHGVHQQPQVFGPAPPYPAAPPVQMPAMQHAHRHPPSHTDIERLATTQNPARTAIHSGSGFNKHKHSDMRTSTTLKPSPYAAGASKAGPSARRAPDIPDSVYADLDNPNKHKKLRAQLRFEAKGGPSTDEAMELRRTLLAASLVDKDVEKPAARRGRLNIVYTWALFMEQYEPDVHRSEYWNVKYVEQYARAYLAHRVSAVRQHLSHPCADLA